MPVAGGGRGGEYRTGYQYGAKRWESNVASVVMHVRLTSGGGGQLVTVEVVS